MGVQGFNQQTEFFVLPLQRCDLVLKVQWLKNLGPIVWDFQALTMQFMVNNEKVTLMGLKGGTILMAIMKQLPKMNHTSDKSLYSQLGEKVMNQDLDLVPQWELQSLLSQFSNLLSHDHHIPLKDETQIVRVRPYRYPTFQKNEIEKIVREMKSAGIIRDSNSPFASPIILVKKKDGTWRMCVDYTFGLAP